MPKRKRRLRKKNRKENVLDFIKKIWESRITWILIAFFFGYILKPYLDPIFLPAISEKPELSIKVFQSHASYYNGENVFGVTWNSSYAEYLVTIQQNMSKAKSTTIEDTCIVFDFNATVLAIHEEKIMGVTNPSIDTPEITSNIDVKSLQIIVEFQRLIPGGVCGFAVIVNPAFEGSFFRSIIIPENSYSGNYFYDARGIRVKKSISGSIPAPRES